MMESMMSMKALEDEPEIKKSIFNAGVTMGVLSWVLQENLYGMGLEEVFAHTLDSLVTVHEGMAEAGWESNGDEWKDGKNPQWPGEDPSFIPDEDIPDPKEQPKRTGGHRPSDEDPSPKERPEDGGPSDFGRGL